MVQENIYQAWSRYSQAINCNNYLHSIRWFQRECPGHLNLHLD